MKKILWTVLLFCSIWAHGQLVINEVDADTPSADEKEFVELKSATPNFSLDGYVLVFFNGTTAGTGTSSYYAVDLDSYITDINGIIHFGNPLVSPTPAILIPNATIQNGPDAVALYQGNALDFPTNTTATIVGLIDVLAYSNSATIQPDALMSVFGLTVCVNENETSAAATKSIQRKNNLIWASPEAYQQFMSDQKYAILAVIIKHKPQSVYQLAKILNRAQQNVARDCDLLEGHGFIKFEQSEDGRKAKVPLLAFDYNAIMVCLPSVTYKVEFEEAA